MSRWKTIVGETSWLRSDLIAGVTLAAYMVPAAIGDASLANLPPEAGLYACVFSGLVFWLFCSSRHTVITVTSALSLLVGASLGEIAGGDPARFAALATATALLVGALGIVAWLVRAGSIVDFISESVMVGFKTGIALVIASTQLPKLCGFDGGHGSFWERAEAFVQHVDRMNPVALAVGGCAVAALVAGKVWLPRKPVSLLVVVGAIVAARAFELDSHGVRLLGSVPGGLPTLGLPAVALDDLNDLLPLAVACFLIGAVESAAIGRMFARKHGHRLDANREFLALGVSNLAAGVGGGYAVSGGMSQSLVNESAGARSPTSGLIAAVLVLAVILFLSGLLAALPQPVLAAIVLMAVTSLVDPAALKRLWRAHRTEFWVAVAAAVGVLASGVLRGVMIGALISIALLLRRAARPHVAFLGRVPGMERFSDLDRNPENEPIPGALLFRCEASLVYFNAESVREAVEARVSATAEPVRVVICDLSTSPHVDLAGIEMLESLHGELAARGIRFLVVEARASVRDTLRAEGLDAKLGHISHRASLASAVRELEQETA